MNTTKQMFDYYIKNYSLDALKENGESVKVFFKEITDQNHDDRKFMFANLGELSQGEIVEVDSVKWLVFQQAESLTHEAYSKMIVLRVNHLVKFGIDSILQSSYGVIELGNQSVSGSKYPFADGKMIITMPRNSFTERIRSNDRILKFNSAWTVQQVSTEYLGLVSIYLEKTSIIDGDDIINEIPNGVLLEPIVVGESRFNKTSFSITKGYSSSVSIYEYMDDIPTDTTFTFRVERINSANYSIQSTTGNSISIKCINFYYTGTLIATNLKTNVEYAIPMILEGLF